jgi:hypothetical protein
MTNIGAIAGVTNLGPVFGDLQGAVAATILGQNNDGSFDIQHYWVSTTGDTIKFNVAHLKPPQRATSWPCAGETSSPRSSPSELASSRTRREGLRPSGWRISNNLTTIILERLTLTRTACYGVHSLVRGMETLAKDTPLGDGNSIQIAVDSIPRERIGGPIR